jgi:hypothetical protein
MTRYNPEIVWAAGFFDGEGSIRATSSSGKGKSASARCTVTNTDPRPVMKFHELFGGVVSVRENALVPNWRRSFEWTIQGAELDSFIRSVLPFCVVKREQLELLVEFRKLMPGRGWRNESTETRWKRRKSLSKLSSEIQRLKWVEAND